MWSKAFTAILLLAAGPALAEDPCEAVFMDGPEDSMETDGFTYTGDQSKTRIPEGVLPAARQAVLDAGISEGYFEDHLLFHVAEVEYEMPGCATWLGARIGWEHAVGPWTVIVDVDLAPGPGGVEVSAVTPAGVHEVATPLDVAEATAAIGTCGQITGELWDGYCTGSDHVCASAAVLREGGGTGTGRVDVETGEVTCADDDTSAGGNDGTIPPGGDGGEATGGEGPGDTGGDEPGGTGGAKGGEQGGDGAGGQQPAATNDKGPSSSCAASPGTTAPWALLLALAALVRRRRAC